MVEGFLKVLETGYYEVTFAFQGLSDENVWKRPTDTLLSVGELAGHIAYWEALRLAGNEAVPLDIAENHPSVPDLTKCQVSSPLIDHRFRYYTGMIADPPGADLRAMTGEQVCRELVRVHQESIAVFRARNPDPQSVPPGLPPGNTYSAILEYLAFHVAYHTGQMYSVRHLLGDTTPDN